MEIALESLESLRVDGWSYSIGYIQQFKSYVCRIYRPLEKWRKVRAVGGKDIYYCMETYSGQGENFYFAIQDALLNKQKNIKEEKTN